MILVSSCLCGEECKYNGGHNFNQAVINYCNNKEITKVCPEVWGGLSIPRTPAEIVGGTAKDVLDGKAKVITVNGNDVTSAFIKGAYLTLEKAKEVGAKTAVFKANSPSCGKGQVYNGLFNNQLTAGNGITTELLMREGIEVLTENELEEKLE